MHARNIQVHDWVWRSLTQAEGGCGIIINKACIKDRVERNPQCNEPLFQDGERNMKTKRHFIFLLSMVFLPVLLGFGCGDTSENGTEPGDGTEQVASVQYRSEEYGFSIDLPASWNGYTVSTDTWEAISLDSVQSSDPAGEGPVIHIVHPGSTEEDPRQDIPIMVFTMAEFDSVQQEAWGVSAAPFPPTELGRNSSYVLAIPPRYNYSYLQGWEEVEEILQSGALHTFEPCQ
jgi:hypothetical protein